MAEMSVGAKIRQFRKQRGLTQEELAKKTNLAVMSIRRYESGERIVPEEYLRRIAAVLDVAPYEFDRRLYLRILGDDVFLLSDGSLASLPSETSEARLLRSFLQLNPEAQIIAVERVEELAKIPEYQREGLTEIIDKISENTNKNAAPGGTNTESGESDKDQ